MESFFQIFKTLILDNDDVTDVQKLIYLKSCRVNEPIKRIENLQLVDDSLKLALDTLKQRYDH